MNTLVTFDRIDNEWGARCNVAATLQDPQPSDDPKDVSIVAKFWHVASPYEVDLSTATARPFDESTCRPFRVPKKLYFGGPLRGLSEPGNHVALSTELIAMSIGTRHYSQRVVICRTKKCKKSGRRSVADPHVDVGINRRSLYACDGQHGEARFTSIKALAMSPPPSSHPSDRTKIAVYVCDKGLHDGPACIRRLDPWNGTVETVHGRLWHQLDLEKPVPCPQGPPQGEFTEACVGLVVDADETVYFTHRCQVFRLERGDPAATVVAEEVLYGVPIRAFCDFQSLALDDERGILFIATFARIYAVSVPTSKTRRRERFMRVALVLRLVADRRATVAFPSSFFWTLVSRWRPRQNLPRILQMLADVSRHAPVIVELILQFLSNKTYYL